MNPRSWVEVDEARLAENYRVVCDAAGDDTDVLAVIKANAYGHGLERCAVALARAGAKWLGVADAAEGMRVRQALRAASGEAGPSTSPRTSRETPPGMTDFSGVEILVMCGVTRDEAGTVLEHGLTPVVWTTAQMGWLGEAMRVAGERDAVRSARRVHLEIETGMGRQGAQPGAEFEGVLRAIADAGLELAGICTHLSSAEVGGSERTREQKRRFEEAVEQVRAARLTPTWLHAGSSSSVDLGEQIEVANNSTWLEELAQSIDARAMVRSGIALYGYCLPIAQENTGANPNASAASAGEMESQIRAKLKPVMTWKTRALDVRHVAAGETIGYNATFTAKETMRVALLPAGYADGLRRELSGTNERAGGWVMVRGSDGGMRRANIVGRVSMNLTTVDVTGIDGVEVGDEAVLLGDGVTADDHARIAGTIAYEILCGIKASSQF